MAYVSSSRTAGNGVVERLATVVRVIRDMIERRRVYNRTLRELRALSNRELADLGLHRAMITRVAAEAAYGK